MLEQFPILVVPRGQWYFENTTNIVLVGPIILKMTSKEPDSRLVTLKF